MKSKLTIKADHLKNFCIDTVKEYEGCASALRYLKAKYGDRVEHLADCEDEVIEIIMKDNKGEWVINFLLNMIKPQFRCAFYAQHLFKALDNIEDTELRDNLQLAFDSFSKKTPSKDMSDIEATIERHFSHIDSELSYPHPENIHDKLQFERLVVESVRFFITDKERKFTRHVTDGLIKLAESTAYEDLVKYNYDVSIQEVALSLMEFTGLWKTK